MMAYSILLTVPLATIQPRRVGYCTYLSLQQTFLEESLIQIILDQFMLSTVSSLLLVMPDLKTVQNNPTKLMIYMHVMKVE